MYQCILSNHLLDKTLKFELCTYFQMLNGSCYNLSIFNPKGRFSDKIKSVKKKKKKRKKRKGTRSL